MAASTPISTQSITAAAQSASTAAVNGLTVFANAQKADLSAAATWFASFLSARQSMLQTAIASAVTGQALDLQFFEADIAVGLEAEELTILALESQQAQALLMSLLTTAANAAVGILTSAAIAAA